MNEHKMSNPKKRAEKMKHFPKVKRCEYRFEGHRCKLPTGHGAVHVIGAPVGDFKKWRGVIGDALPSPPKK